MVGPWEFQQSLQKSRLIYPRKWLAHCKPHLFVPRRIVGYIESRGNKVVGCLLPHWSKSDGGTTTFRLGEHGHTRVLDTNDPPLDPLLDKSFEPVSHYGAFKKIDVPGSFPFPAALFPPLKTNAQVR